MASVAEFIQCDSRNYTAGRQGNRIRKIVVHYTGTEASAHNNLLYFSRSSAGASAHYFIDKDGTLRQLVSEGDTAWHAGHWATNLCSVGIEVVSGGADFTEAQINTLATLVADIRSRCGVSADDVIRHYDVTGKLCPAPYVDGSKWAALHERICGGAASSGGGSGSGGSGGGPAPSGDVSELARRVINGEFGNGDVRKAALGRQLRGCAEARERDAVVTRQKLREEIAWWLAVIAGGLLCLILLPLYPLCWVVDKFENELRD